MSQKTNLYPQTNIRHEDKYLYYDTAFITNDATGCKYMVIYRYINVALCLL